MENYFINFSISTNSNIKIIEISPITRYVNLVNFSYIGDVEDYKLEFKNLEALYIDNLNF